MDIGAALKMQLELPQCFISYFSGETFLTSTQMTMKPLFLILQQADIEKKIQEAPDSAYEIGVVIGSYLPFVILAGIAYALYYYNKIKRGSE